MKSSHKAILIVEDNLVNMVLLVAILEPLGYEVLQAINGTEGWRIACERRPDLILMDIQLPDVSGLEVTKRLKSDETLKSIPIIAVTAYTLDNQKEEILNGGCDAHIPKPIPVSEIPQIVEAFLTEAGPGPIQPRLNTTKKAAKSRTKTAARKAPAKSAAKRAAGPKKSKTAARKTTAKRTAKSVAKKAPVRKATGKTASAAKKAKAKAKPYGRLKERQGDPGARLT
jgi:two-component system cell cycle response regulator DivK